MCNGKNSSKTTQYALNCRGGDSKYWVIGCFLRVSSCAFQALLAPARHFFNGQRLIQSCGDNDIDGFIVKRLNTGLVFVNSMRKSSSL